MVRFLVDRVRVSPPGYTGHGFCVCDIQTFLCPGHDDIKQPCRFSDFLRSLLVKERIDTIGYLEDDHVLKLKPFCLVHPSLRRNLKMYCIFGFAAIHSFCMNVSYKCSSSSTSRGDSNDLW